MEYIWEPYLTEKGSLLIASDPGVGKTQLSLFMAQCLATGSLFLETKLPKVTSLFISMEMGIPGIRYVAEHQWKHWNEKQRKDLEENFRVVAPGHGLTYKELDAIIREHSPTVVFFDSILAMAPKKLGEETVAEMMAWDAQVRERYSTATVWIHHLRKQDQLSSPNQRNMHDIFGGVGISRHIDTLTMLTKQSSGSIRCSFEKVRYGAGTTFMLNREKDLTFSKSTRNQARLVEVAEDANSDDSGPTAKDFGM
jgi:RecA-family ATPase